MSASLPLVECVVNVSEGRDPDTLAALALAIAAVPGCYLLHTDTGAGAHRTVFTFAGSPDAVFAAARRVYEVAHARIDMRHHRGTHPRLGAVDVCPFVPISGVSTEEIKAQAQVLGQWVAERFGLPVYLYAESAAGPARANLADVRRGEFEGLAARMEQPGWRPDFGPAIPHPTLGATVIGVRPFLIAWNINLSAEATLPQARKLAARLRGSGAGGRAGLFPGLKAIGWFIEEYGRCQISCNVVDPARTPLARVYLTAVGLAREMELSITGSELIGLVPAPHLRAAARGFCLNPDYAAEMETAVAVLGLDDLGPFNWPERVLEERYRAAVQTGRQT
ncbi:glutamate formimidoyltransferase [Lewinella sp. IMCC34183]|uniref:glutamate formimidoyltransferase n=1 Tax=Lewinella sp. IMCC34183 TaxID=2248762 RepID=UPI000E23D6CF|nr:glutamate formimidoyltransferase [Lewinella sp. IMCC34183]